MARSAPFRLNRTGLLLALISTAFAGQVQGAAGRVEFAIGPATVVGADGRTRPASRGTEVDTGDTVRTQENGRVQVRMADGAYISLQPNTEFGIKNYRFEGKTDGSENALYSLLKGAMRTVTGLIGRVNRNRYQVSTPTATVGIRGTGGLIQVLNDGATLVQGTSGIWFLANPAGTIDIPAGVSGIAPADPKQPPKETVQIPVAGPVPLPPLPPFIQGDTKVLISGPGYSAAIAWGGFGVDNVSDAAAIFNADGQMTSLTQSLFFGYTLVNGSHADFGTDGVLAWGRWTGDAVVPCDGLCNITYDANQGLHYVVGLPTAAMPTSGTATYTLLGATRPTFTDGSATPGTFSGSLNVNFGLRSTGVGLNLNVGIDGKNYTVTGNAPISGNTFSGFSGSVITGGSGGACTQGCSTNVGGFFAGTNADRAGLAYNISDFGIQKDITGAAAFAKQ